MFQQWPELSAALGALVVSIIVAITAWFKNWSPGEKPPADKSHLLTPAMNVMHDDAKSVVEQLKRIGDIAEKILFIEGLRVGRREDTQDK